MPETPGTGARLVIVGGGGFRVPLVYRALAEGPFAGLVSDVVLLDAQPERARAIARVLKALPRRGGGPQPSVRVEDRLEDALPGADVVFAAVRSGGTEDASSTSVSPWPPDCSGRRPWAPEGSPTRSAPSRT